MCVFEVLASYNNTLIAASGYCSCHFDVVLLVGETKPLLISALLKILEMIS